MLHLGPRVLREVTGVWGIFVFFLASFLFPLERPRWRELCFIHQPHLMHACSKPLSPEMGFCVMLGLEIVQDRSRGYGHRAVESLSSRRDQTHFCCRQRSSLCSRSDPPARHEKPMEASPPTAKKGISIIFISSGCHAMTFVLQLKIRLQRAFSNAQ